MSGKQEEEDFVVEAVLDLGLAEEDGSLLFHIRFAGYPPERDLWLPLESILGAHTLVQAFLRSPQGTKALKNKEILLQARRVCQKKEYLGLFPPLTKSAKKKAKLAARRSALAGARFSGTPRETLAFKDNDDLGHVRADLFGGPEAESRLPVPTDFFNPCHVVGPSGPSDRAGSLRVQSCMSEDAA
jgi:hypothetical protein